MHYWSLKPANVTGRNLLACLKNSFQYAVGNANLHFWTLNLQLWWICFDCYHLVKPCLSLKKISFTTTTFIRLFTWISAFWSLLRISKSANATMYKSSVTSPALKHPSTCSAVNDPSGWNINTYTEYIHILHYYTVNTNAIICKEHFMVVSAQGGGSFNYFIHRWIGLVQPPTQDSRDLSEGLWDD